MCTALSRLGIITVLWTRREQALPQGSQASMPSAYPIVTSDQLRATAELLRLPENATASALCFMHRFKRDCREFDMPDDVWLHPECFLLSHSTFSSFSEFTKKSRSQH